MKYFYPHPSGGMNPRKSKQHSIKKLTFVGYHIIIKYSVCIIYQCLNSKMTFKVAKRVHDGTARRLSHIGQSQPHTITNYSS